MLRVPVKNETNPELSDTASVRDRVLLWVIKRHESIMGAFDYFVND